MRSSSAPFFRVTLAALVCAGPLLLTACQDAEPVSPIALPVRATPVDPDPVGWRLAQAAEKASNSTQKLAQIEAFRTPMPNESGTGMNLPGMQQPVSITWAGPIEQITRTLAEMAGLGFRTQGAPPPLPIAVKVEAFQQPIGRIIQDIGHQAGRRADIMLDPATNALLLRYAPTDGLTYY